MAVSELYAYTHDQQPEFDRSSKTFVIEGSMTGEQYAIAVLYREQCQGYKRQREVLREKKTKNLVGTKKIL